MRIALLAAGSRGDYQPVVAVGRGLAARGHEVGVTATTDFVRMVETGGLRAEEVRMDLMRHYREEVLAGWGMPEGLTGQLGLIGQVARLIAPEVARTMHGLAGRYDGFVTTALSARWPGLFGAGRPQVLMMFVPGLCTRNPVAGTGSLRAAVGAVVPGGTVDVDGVTGPDRALAGRRRG